VQAGGDALLAAAGFAFDQHRKGRGGVLLDLLAQLVHRRAVADDAGILGRGGDLVGSALGILYQQGVEHRDSAVLARTVGEKSIGRAPPWRALASSLWPDSTES